MKLKELLKVGDYVYTRGNWVVIRCKVTKVLHNYGDDNYIRYEFDERLFSNGSIIQLDDCKTVEELLDFTPLYLTEKEVAEQIVKHGKYEIDTIINKLCYVKKCVDNAEMLL